MHTPASVLNNEFGTDWDQYVQRLFRTLIQKEISAVALTDYFTIDGYKKVKQDYLAQPKKLQALFSKEEIDKIAHILVLPNIEFRLNKLVGPNRVNAHVILSDELSIKDIEENFLHDLSFTNQAQPESTAEKRKLKVDNLKDLGSRLTKEHERFASQDPLFTGMMNAVVDEEDIFHALQDSRFRDKFLFCVVADEDLPKLSWDSQDHLVRKLLIRRSSALFSGNPSTRNWALARKPQYSDGQDHFLNEFQSLKACLHGSDAHGYEEIGHPCAKRGDKKHSCVESPDECELRYCWIKADPTFEGLRQILHEPAERAYIGPSAPVYFDEARVIDSIELRNGRGWFADIDVPLNPGMVSIIGQKGSGKSALADLIAFAAGSWDPEDRDSFLRRAGEHLNGMQITLNWADGDSSSQGVVGRDGEDKAEVRYLSQNYVERVCARDGVTKELVGEIEKVIFNYLDPVETLNASDFDELRAIKTESARNEGERLRVLIDQIIRDECSLRDQIGKLREKEGRVRTLGSERVGLLKQVPAPSSEAEKKVQNELQEKRVALSKAQQLAAAEKQNVQRISDLRARILSFQSQMVGFFDEVKAELTALGAKPEDVVKFKPVFVDDTEPPLKALGAEIKSRILKIQGGDPPESGTIKKLQLDIADLSKLETADKARQERLKQVQTRIAVISTELERLNKEIEKLKTTGRNQVEGLQAKRLESYVSYFKNMKLEQQALEELYDPIKPTLMDQTLLEGGQLEFAIKWTVDLKSWLGRGVPLFDQRRTIPYGSFDELSEAARKILAPALGSGDPARIEQALEEFMKEFRRDDLSPRNYLRSEVSLQDLLGWIYEVDHVKLEYGLKFNEADLESLSPGTKGIVLLILYLGLDTSDSRPLVVDQPDENLDNESIYKLLTPYFRMAKSRRQIIVITHNPNLVVNSDSEQVIIASTEKQANGLPKISYCAGALENNVPQESDIRKQVCNILEGGDDAFRKRERRYAMSSEA